MHYIREFSSTLWLYTYTAYLANLLIFIYSCLSFNTDEHLVERIENPRVGGSIPPLATK